MPLLQMKANLFPVRLRLRHSAKFMGQNRFIDRFKKPWAKGRVDLERGIDNFFGNFIFSQF
jgi:hypothetical protein